MGNFLRLHRARIETRNLALGLSYGSFLAAATLFVLQSANLQFMLPQSGVVLALQILTFTAVAGFVLCIFSMLKNERGGMLGSILALLAMLLASLTPIIAESVVA